MKRLGIILFAIIITPLTLFGLWLSVSDFINFHVDTHAQEPLLFVGDHGPFIILLLLIIFILFAAVLYLALMRRLPKYAPRNGVNSEAFEALSARIWKLCGITVSVLGIVLFISIFTVERYLRIYAIEHGYIYCAKQYGTGKSSDVLLFTLEPQTCQDFKASGLSVRDFRKQEVYDKFWQGE